jgi:uncharacterized protein YfaS (alpha-2-macroglobulin family)
MALSLGNAEGAACSARASETYWQGVVEPLLEQHKELLMKNQDADITAEDEWKWFKEHLKNEAQYTDLNNEFAPEIRETMARYTSLLTKEGKAKNYKEEAEMLEAQRYEAGRQWQEENEWRRNKTGYESDENRNYEFYDY